MQRMRDIFYVVERELLRYKNVKPESHVLACTMMDDFKTHHYISAKEKFGAILELAELISKRLPDIGEAFAESMMIAVASPPMTYEELVIKNQMRNTSIHPETRQTLSNHLSLAKEFGGKDAMLLLESAPVKKQDAEFIDHVIQSTNIPNHAIWLEVGEPIEMTKTNIRLREKGGWFVETLFENMYFKTRTSAEKYIEDKRITPLRILPPPMLPLISRSRDNAERAAKKLSMTNITKGFRVVNRLGDFCVEEYMKPSR